MSCKLWSKITSVSVNINFVQKCQFCAKRIEILGEMLTFSLSVDYYWKWLSFCKMCLFLEKSDFLCEGLYTLTKCDKKTSISLDMLICICVNFSLKYFICRIIVILIQNIILCNDILGRVSFS